MILNTHENKANFERIVLDNIKREGINELMTWLCNDSDFFKAPASTKFHLACEGGLCDHSLRVHGLLLEKFRKFEMPLSPGEEVPLKVFRTESIALTGLFHDICKTNFYKKKFLQDRNITERAEKETYEVNDLFPMGHGEKSVFILQKYIKLTDMEIAMIRWHMAAYDPSIHFDYPNGYAFRDAVKLFPTIYLMITADLEATMLEGML